MARQYLFFKLTSEDISYIDAGKLFQIELSTYFSNIHKINNVFELYRFPEIRQLIEKDFKLQKHITHALPDSENHGYLALTDSLPPIEKLIKRLAYCDEFLLFQRTHEPKDAYLRYLSGKGVIKQLKIYNWIIFIIRTLRSFYDPVSDIVRSLPTPDKIDRLLNDPGNLNSKNRQKHADPLHQHSQTLDPLNTYTSRFSAAMFNMLIKKDHSFVEIPAISAHLLRHASLTGNKATGYIQTPLQSMEFRLRTQFHNLDKTIIWDAVNKAIGLLNQLLENPKFKQSHLFYSDIDGSYKSHESIIFQKYTELSSYKRHLKLYRYIIAARFLIDQQIITHDDTINLFLTFNLLQTIFQAINRKRASSFINEFEINAQNLISEMHICQKMRELFVLKPKTAHIIEGSFSMLADKSDNKHAYFVRLPGQATNNNFYTKNHINIALKLFQTRSNPISSQEISQSLKNFYQKKLEANLYTNEKLDFYRSFLPREEFLSLSDQCINTLFSLDQLVTQLKTGDRLCILSPNRCHFIDDNPHEFSFSRIILDYMSSLDNLTVSTKHQTQIDAEDPCLKHEIALLEFS